MNTNALFSLKKFCVLFTSSSLYLTSRNRINLFFSNQRKTKGMKENIDKDVQLTSKISLTRSIVTDFVVFTSRIRRPSRKKRYFLGSQAIA